jgi:hypothetical protein
MLRLIKVLLSLGALFTLVSCGSMSKKECLVADWYQIGLEDGTRGLLPSHLARHRKACAKASVTPDLNEYERGHAQGLIRYCVALNGRKLGERGTEYNGVCAGVNEAAFLKAYREGHAIYEQLQLVRSIENDIAALEAEIVDRELHAEELEALIASNETSGPERIEYVAEIVELKLQIQDILDSIDALYPELERERRHYHRMSE